MINHLTSHMTWTTCLFCKLVTTYKLFLLLHLHLLSSPSYGSLAISRYLSLANELLIYLTLLS
jgi:hypothetical protein